MHFVDALCRIHGCSRFSFGIVLVPAACGLPAINDDGDDDDLCTNVTGNDDYLST